MNQIITRRSIQSFINHNIHNYHYHHQSSIRSRSFATGTRGARGHGWLHKYRSGEGGRHLQGRYHKRDLQKLTSINDQVFALNEKIGEDSPSSSQETAPVLPPTRVFLDFAMEGGGGGDESLTKNDVDDSPQPSTSTTTTTTQRVIIELASAALPNTCRNFVDLCNAKDGEVGYKHSKVFRILPKVGLCLGDTTHWNNGKQGRCSPMISETGMFADEPTVVSHSEKGIVSMLSTGVDKNDSRFMITTVEDAPHLDGRYVAFGRVKEGLDSLQEIVKTTYTRRGVPSVNIQVVNCGVL